MELAQWMRKRNYMGNEFMSKMNDMMNKVANLRLEVSAVKENAIIKGELGELRRKKESSDKEVNPLGTEIGKLTVERDMLKEKVASNVNMATNQQEIERFRKEHTV